MKVFVFLFAISFAKVVVPEAGKYKTITTQEIVVDQNPNEPFKLAFGSCFQLRDYRSDIFKEVHVQKPEVWVWGGDAAYTDAPYGATWQLITNKTTTSFDYVRERFEMTSNETNYAKMAAATTVVGTWDDHDYGNNNAGSELPTKNEIREIFLDFIGEPEGTARRLEKDRGIYQDYVFETSDGVKVLLILSDGRFDYDKTSAELDRLGEKQWAWLEQVLEEHQTDLTIFVAGVQLMADRWIYLTESFRQFSRNRLIELFRKQKRDGLFILSGDVHHTALQTQHCAAPLGYKITELVSSGLSHIMGQSVKPPLQTYGLPLITNKRFYLQELEGHKFNFALLKIYKEDGRVILEGSSRSDVPADAPIFEFKYDVQRDLKFSEERFLFKKSCYASNLQNSVLFFQALYYEFIVKRYFWTLLMMWQALFLLAIYGSVIVAKYYFPLSFALKTLKWAYTKLN